MNVVILIGTLTKDPELKKQKDFSVCNFSVALNESYTNKDNEKVEKTHFFDIVSFGRTAENVAKYFKKGLRIAIRGKLSQERWADKESVENRSKVVVYLEDFTFVDCKKKEAQADE